MQTRMQGVRRRTPKNPDSSSFVRHKTKKHPFHRSVIDQLKPLYKYDNYHAVFALIEDYAVIALTIMASLVAWNTFGYLALVGYPLVALIIGARQRGFATLLHEASHGSLAKNKTLNFAFGTYFSAYWIFQTFYPYKKSHCKEHHRFLGDIEHDPDLQYYASQGLFEMGSQFEFLKRYLLPNWLLLKTPQNLWYLIKNRLLVKDLKSQSSKLKNEYIKFVCFWVVVVSVLIYTGWWIYFLIFWILPLLTTFQSLNCTIEVCEHYPIIIQSNQEIYMTRNRNGSWLENFFSSIHAENYHMVHHVFCGIPFWNLKKAHQILLQDEEYKFIDDHSGGIITPSRVGGKNIIQTMFSN